MRLPRNVPTAYTMLVKFLYYLTKITSIIINKLRAYENTIVLPELLIALLEFQLTNLLFHGIGVEKKSYRNLKKTKQRR